MRLSNRLRTTDEDRLLRLQERLSKPEWEAAVRDDEARRRATPDHPPGLAFVGKLMVGVIVGAIPLVIILVIFLAALRILGWF